MWTKRRRTFSCPWPSDKYFSLLVPNPVLSASFIRSLPGSDPGLRMKTIGDMGELCSKMDSKLMMGGMTYFSPMISVTYCVTERKIRSTRKQRSSMRRWNWFRLSSYLPGTGWDSGMSWSNHWNKKTTWWWTCVMTLSVIEITRTGSIKLNPKFIWVRINLRRVN